MIDTKLRDKFTGALLGHAIGDAIGELAFTYNSRSQLDSAINSKKILRYTDDTAMAIGCAQSLIEKEGKFDTEHMGTIFMKNYEAEPWRGYASGPPFIFDRIKKENISFKKAASELFNNTGSFGNGAAMRIAPVALLFHNLIPIKDLVIEASQITHSHKLGIDGSVTIAESLGIVIKHDIENKFSPKELLYHLREKTETEEFKEKFLSIRKLLDSDVNPDIASSTLGQSVSALESVPFAIYSFLKNSDSFKDCLYSSTLNEGDCDTLGAMACSLSGAYLSYHAIPGEWLEKLENRDEIEEIAIKLYELNQKLKQKK